MKRTEKHDETSKLVTSFFYCMCLKWFKLNRGEIINFTEWHSVCLMWGFSRYLEYSVLVLVLGCVACCVFPGDLEAHGVPFDPHQARVSTAVHLGDQPGLQAHTTRGDRHLDCVEKTWSLSNLAL